MSTSRTTKNTGRHQESQKDVKEKKDLPSSLTEASVKEDTMNVAEILRELTELRKENQESFTDTKASLFRLESSVTDLKERMEKLEQRTRETQSRISAAEDTGQRHERTLRYLVRREAATTNLCDDLQNRLHRNNLRIYQVPEGSEKNDTVGFVKQLIKNQLQLKNEDIQIERVHHSPGLKPGCPAPSRSIIVRFLDYTVKEAVLRQA
ncbi:hypothetical protein LDENG_00222540 [Lucifuga dentata]|nr:hypothetical protein LDENG_00222540 [Lucifuga dentata]